MKTFAKIIGASCGMVALLFALVAAVLHWSAETPLPQPPTALTAPDPLPTPDTPTPEPIEKPATQKPIPSSQQAQPVPTSPVATAAAIPVKKQPPKEETPKMSTDEYVARQMHYIGKIQQDAQTVLARAAEQRQKTAQLEAELDDLLYQ